MKSAIASTFVVAVLAASSFAFAADNNNKNNDGGPRDEQTTGSVNTEGRTLTADEREFCVTNPSESKCRGLGGETNQQ